MDTQLHDQVVIVTGASGGIGRATAQVLSAEGARLVLHACNRPEAAHELAAALETDTLVVQADLRLENEVEALFAQVESRFGRIDSLIANAGIWPEEDVPIHEMSLERWQRVVDTNQTAVFLAARRFFRHLAQRHQEHASLVIVGSTAAVFGEAGHAAYAASKAAIVYGLTRTLKNEIVKLAPRGRVNAVCPGWTRTPMAEAGLADVAAVKRVMQTRSLQRIAEADDIARAIVFLASPHLAGHISGQVLTVAGGMEGRLLHDEDAVRTAEWNVD